MKTHRFLPGWLPLAALALAAAACERPGAGQDPADGQADAPIGVVDSVLPMPVMMERFRTGLPTPTELTHGAESRDALVEAVVEALQRADTAAFEGLAVGMSEWAWLYYETSAQAQPPYELPPGLAWMQLQQNNRTGVLRALERLGGRALTYDGYACDPEPTVEVANRIWIGCMVRLGVDGAEPEPMRLFSAVLERDGRFAVLSFANDF